ncbi:TPA: hypothetical protein U5E40_003655 [Yersinia enterocolitica]|nr:hypothetical protein [Yersinia enterocolitica]
MTKSNQLIIRVNNYSNSPVYWCYKAENASAIEGVLQDEHQLAELQVYGQDSQITLVIPAQCVLMREVYFKGKYSASRMEVLAWQLEEFCLGEMDQMHLTLLECIGERYTLAAVEKSLLKKLLELCSTANLYPEYIIPDVLLLPDASPNWSMAKLGETWLVRESTFTGFSIEENELSLWLTRYSELPAIQCYSQLPESIAGDVIESIQPTLPLLIQGLKNNKVNLLHGEFSVKPKLKKSTYHNVIILLTILYIMIFIFEPMLQTFNTHQRTQHIKEQSQQLYSQHFPDKKPTKSTQLQLLEEIALLEKNAVDSTFISLLSQAYPLFSTLVPGETQSMSYRSTTATLSFVIAARKTPLMLTNVPNLAITSHQNKNSDGALMTFTIRKEP